MIFYEILCAKMFKDVKWPCIAELTNQISYIWELGEFLFPKFTHLGMMTTKWYIESDWITVYVNVTV